MLERVASRENHLAIIIIIFLMLHYVAVKVQALEPDYEAKITGSPSTSCVTLDPYLTSLCSSVLVARKWR